MIKMESISRKKEMFFINQYNLLIVMAGFFIGRVHILNKLTPFGIAYLAAALLMNKGSLYIPISVGLGIYSFHGVSGINYFLISLIVYLFLTKKNKEDKYTELKGSFVVSMIFLMTQLIWNIAEGNNQYNLLTLLLEGLIIFTMTYVFTFSFPLEKLKINKYKKEQLICSFIAVAMVLSGLNGIHMYGVSFKNIISIVAVIYLAYSQGMLYGLVASVVIGLISYVSHMEMPFIISILAVGGLFAGLFREIGKSGSILGFLLGNGIISFYINRLATSFFDYRELLFASIVFLVISQFVKFDLKDYINKNLADEDSYEIKKEEYIIDKLNKTGELFSSLSHILKESIEDEIQSSHREVYNTVDEITNGVCKKCSRYQSCWKDNYYKTYQGVFNLMGVMESGIENTDILLSKIEEFCKEPKLLIYKGLQSYEYLKEKQLCDNKLTEQRKLLSDQMENFTRIITDIKEDVRRSPIFHKDLQEELIKELENKRVDIIELIVVEIEEKNLK